MYRDNARPEPIVFTFARPRFILISIGLIGIGLFLTALTWRGSGYDADDRGTLYFFAIPSIVLGLISTFMFVVAKPATVILDGDHIIFRKRRFPLSEVALTEVELRRRGNFDVRAFDIVAADEDGKQVSVEINALNWKDFDRMYEVLAKATRLPEE